MRSNRMVLTVIVTIIAAISISSCTYRSHGPGYGYDYGYGPSYGYRYHRIPPPPPRVVVVKPHHQHRRVIRADRYNSSRYSDKAYRRQYNNGNHYGQRNRTRGPR